MNSDEKRGSMDAIWESRGDRRVRVEEGGWEVRGTGLEGAVYVCSLLRDCRSDDFMRLQNVFSVLMFFVSRDNLFHNCGPV
jgi:hypothetical protein